MFDAVALGATVVAPIKIAPSGFCWILPLAVTHADFVANDPAAYLRLEKDALFYALLLQRIASVACWVDRYWQSHVLDGITLYCRLHRQLEP
jgi:hypothetical protein